MKFLHLAFAAGGAWFGQNNRKGLTHTRTVACSEAVKFDVGGQKYVVQEEDIGKYPSSTLYQMAKLGKDQDKNDIKINRNGPIFKHINTFLLYGQLPRSADGKVMMDEQTLKELKTEADFYGLDGLSVECDGFLQNTIGPDFKSYFSVRDHVYCALDDQRLLGGRVPTDFYIAPVPSLSHALKSLWVPFCAVDRLFRRYEQQFELNVSDVVAAPFLSDINTTENCTVDVTKLNAMVLNEIICKLYDESDNSAFKQFAPHLELTLHPQHLVLQQEGFSQELSRVLPTTNSSEHIGTLVVILNSTYTGGELEVTHNGHTEVVTGPYNWVAMYGDCLHKINPVTSGTRATLVFDVYGEKKGVDANDDKICFDGHYSDHYSKPQALALIDPLHLPTAVQQRNILKSLNKVLHNADSIVLGLEHQYHYNHLRLMPSVGMLTGGDRALYEMLLSSGHYDISMMSFTVQQIERKKPTIHLFSSDTLLKPDAIYETKDDTKRTAVVMPNVINKEWILSDEWVETEGDWDMFRRESVYLVSGLRVSKKKIN